MLILTLPAAAAGVVGGEESRRDANQWQIGLVSLKDAGSAVDPRAIFCGAVLIDADIAVTAAHCLDDAAKRRGTVAAVAWTDFGASGAPTRSYRLILRDCHHGWNGDQSMRHDLAVFRLAIPMTGAQPINLAPQSLVDHVHRTIAEGGALNLGVISGWGVSDKPTRDDMLRTASVRLEAAPACRSILGSSPNPGQRLQRYRQELMLCGSMVRSDPGVGPTPSAGLPCRGDSGGPLSLVHEGRSYLIGIASWTRENDSAKLCRSGPAFFSDALVHVEWLNEAWRRLSNAPKSEPLDAAELRCPGKPSPPLPRGEKT